MTVMRCPVCEATHWQLARLDLDRATTCADCGAELIPERRVPGRAASVTVEERREAPQPTA